MPNSLPVLPTICSFGYRVGFSIGCKRNKWGWPLGTIWEPTPPGPKHAHPPAGWPKTAEMPESSRHLQLLPRTNGSPPSRPPTRIRKFNPSKPIPHLLETGQREECSPNLVCVHYWNLSVRQNKVVEPGSWAHTVTGCVILGKWLPFSEPQFQHLRSERFELDDLSCSE